MGPETLKERIQLTPVAEVVTAIDEKGTKYVKTCGGVPENTTPTISYEFKIDVLDPPAEGFLSINRTLGEVAITLQFLSGSSEIEDCESKKFVELTFTRDQIEDRNAWQLIDDIVHDQLTVEN